MVRQDIWVMAPPVSSTICFPTPLMLTGTVRISLPGSA